MKPIIEFCQNNYHHGTHEVKKILEKKTEYDVLDYNCLSYCELCEEKPFALVEGDLIAADSPNQLLLLIEEKIKEQKQLQDIFDDWI